MRRPCLLMRLSINCHETSDCGCRRHIHDLRACNFANPRGKRAYKTRRDSLAKRITALHVVMTSLGACITSAVNVAPQSAATTPAVWNRRHRRERSVHIEAVPRDGPCLRETRCPDESRETTGFDGKVDKGNARGYAASASIQGAPGRDRHAHAMKFGQCDIRRCVNATPVALLSRDPDFASRLKPLPTTHRSPILNSGGRDNRVLKARIRKSDSSRCSAPANP